MKTRRNTAAMPTDAEAKWRLQKRIDRLPLPPGANATVISARVRPYEYSGDYHDEEGHTLEYEVGGHTDLDADSALARYRDHDLHRIVSDALGVRRGDEDALLEDTDVLRDRRDLRSHPGFSVVWSGTLLDRSTIHTDDGDKRADAVPEVRAGKRNAGFMQKLLADMKANPRARRVSTAVLGERVRVFRNLHTETWSVESATTGRIIAHPDTVLLEDVRLVSRDAGRELARRTGKKNVHAVATGTLVAIDGPAPADLARWTPLYYNPFKVDTFVEFVDGKVGKPVRGSRMWFAAADHRSQYALAPQEADPGRYKKPKVPKRRNPEAQTLMAYRTDALEDALKKAGATVHRVAPVPTREYVLPDQPVLQAEFPFEDHFLLIRLSLTRNVVWLAWPGRDLSGPTMSRQRDMTIDLLVPIIEKLGEVVLFTSQERIGPDITPMLPYKTGWRAYRALVPEGTDKQGAAQAALDSLFADFEHQNKETRKAAVANLAKALSEVQSRDIPQKYREQVQEMFREAFLKDDLAAYHQAVALRSRAKAPRRKNGFLASLALVGIGMAAGVYVEEKQGVAARVRSSLKGKDKVAREQFDRLKRGVLEAKPRARETQPRPTLTIRTSAPITVRSSVMAAVTDPKWVREESPDGKGYIHARTMKGTPYEVFERVYGKGNKVVVLDVGEAHERVNAPNGQDGWPSVAAAKRAAEALAGMRLASV